METQELIDKISMKAGEKRASLKPVFLFAIASLFLGLYACLMQAFIHLRADIYLQLERPAFVFEIILLFFTAVSGISASILSMYPDYYQKHWVTKIPYICFSGLIVFIFSQYIGVPTDTRVHIAPSGGHAIECAIYIGIASMLPAAVMFGFIWKGATVNPKSAGLCAVLSTTSVAMLTLRLSEQNDSVQHLLAWHYAPVVIFATIGVFAAKYFLKW